MLFNPLTSLILYALLINTLLFRVSNYVFIALLRAQLALSFYAQTKVS
jgi:hypothetical protein